MLRRCLVSRREARCLRCESCLLLRRPLRGQHILLLLLGTQLRKLLQHE